MSQTIPSHSHYSGDLGISSFFRYGDNISGHRSHTSQFSTYNHGGLNIAHSRFHQEDIPRVING